MSSVRKLKKKNYSRYVHMNISGEWGSIVGVFYKSFSQRNIRDEDFRKWWR